MNSVYVVLFHRNIVTVEKMAAKDVLPRPASKSATKSVVAVLGFETTQMRRACWNLNESNQFVEMCNIALEIPLYHSACKVPEGFAITGGEGSDLCIAFNASKKVWSKLRSLLTKRQGHCSIYINGVLYVFGGLLSNDMIKSVNCLDFPGGTWRKWPRGASSSFVFSGG